jgi:hypothetical protein
MHCDPAYLQDGTESTLLKNPLSISSAQNLSDYGKDILNPFFRKAESIKALHRNRATL